MSTNKKSRTGQTVTIWGELGTPQETSIYADRADVDLTLEDGRTVRVGVLDTGQVIIRAWAGDPYATDNADVVSVSFHLPTLEDMVVDGAQVTGMNMQSHALTPRSLTSPDRDGCWHLASQQIRDRVQGIRTLLALRGVKTGQETRS